MKWSLIVYTVIYWYIPSINMYILVYILVWESLRESLGDFLGDFHCDVAVTQGLTQGLSLRLSLTCTARKRQQASHLAATTQLLWTDEGAAISTKSTRGCGGLGAASPALGACRSIRLQRGRMLSAMCCTSGQPRQNGLARRLYPDSK